MQQCPSQLCWVWFGMQQGTDIKTLAPMRLTSIFQRTAGLGKETRCPHQPCTPPLHMHMATPAPQAERAVIYREGDHFELKMAKNDQTLPKWLGLASHTEGLRNRKFWPRFSAASCSRVGWGTAAWGRLMAVYTHLHHTIPCHHHTPWAGRGFEAGGCIPPTKFGGINAPSVHFNISGKHTF